MHDHTDPTEAPEGEGAPAEEHTPQEDVGAEQPAPDTSQPEEEAEQQGMPGAPFGNLDYTEAVTQMAQMFAPVFSRILDMVRGPGQQPAAAVPHIRPPQPPPAQIAMPRDVAHRLLMELYAPKPDPDPTNRSFRVGMALGSAINSMGWQILSEDLMAMLNTAWDKLFNRGSGADLSDVYRSAYPVAQPYDPIENFEMPPGSPRVPEGTLGVVPGGEDLRQQLVDGLREDAKRRWAEIQEQDPERAEKINADIGGIEDIFNHFEDLFGDFFDPHRAAAPAPDGDEDSEPFGDPSPGDAE